MDTRRDRTVYVAQEADDAKKLSHDDYLAFLEEATARIVGAEPDTLANHAKGHDGEYATDYDGLGGTADLCRDVASNPDLVYETEDVAVYGEAKSTLSECSRKDFATQVYDLLTLACASGARRRYVVLSVPFCALGEAKQTVVKVLRRMVAAQEADEASLSILQSLLDGKHERHVKGGSIALSFDPSHLRDGEICVSYCSEVDGKAVPEPSSLSGGTIDDKSRYEDTGYESNSYEDLENVRYPVMRTTVSIDDDRLLFDDLNNRILGSDRTPLKQAQCYEMLLSDGDVDARNRNKAHQRRRDIIGGLSIHQPVDLFLDEEGALVLVDGNSRLAEARYIARHAAPGAAGGFRRLKANIFSYEEGITREKIDAIKNARQHEVKVDHDKIRDAFVIYDKSTHEHWEIERIRSYFKGYYSDNLISGSIETVKRLKDIGYSDGQIQALYDSMYYLSNAGIKTSRVKGYAVSQKDWKRIARRLDTERMKVEAGSVRDTQSYLSGSLFQKTVQVVMKPTHKNDARKAILEDWLNEEEELATPEAFIKALAETSKKRSVREQQMEKLQRIERDVDAVTAFLTTIVYESDEDIKDVVGLTKRDMQAMHATITELLRKANALRALNGALGEQHT